MQVEPPEPGETPAELEPVGEAHVASVLFVGCWEAAEARLEAAPGPDVIAALAVPSPPPVPVSVQVRRNPRSLHCKLGGSTPGPRSPVCPHCSNAMALVFTLPVENGTVTLSGMAAVTQIFQCRLHPHEVRV